MIYFYMWCIYFCIGLLVNAWFLLRKESFLTLREAISYILCSATISFVPTLMWALDEYGDKVVIEKKKK